MSRRLPNFRWHIPTSQHRITIAPRAPSTCIEPRYFSSSRRLRNDDPHKTLGVPKNATKAQINRAFVDKIRLSHPDFNKGRPTGSNFDADSLKRARDFLLAEHDKPVRSSPRSLAEILAAQKENEERIAREKQRKQREDEDRIARYDLRKQQENNEAKTREFEWQKQRDEHQRREDERRRAEWEANEPMRRKVSETRQKERDAINAKVMASRNARHAAQNKKEEEDRIRAENILKATQRRLAQTGQQQKAEEPEKKKQWLSVLWPIIGSGIFMVSAWTVTYAAATEDNKPWFWKATSEEKKRAEEDRQRSLEEYRYLKKAMEEQERARHDRLLQQAHEQQRYLREEERRSHQEWLMRQNAGVPQVKTVPDAVKKT